MSEYLPGTLIAVSKERLSNVDEILDPMFLMEGMQLRQITQLMGIEAHTVQNWVKRGFVDSPVKKFYDRERFVRLAILNYYKDVFSLEGILSLLRMANQDNIVYSSLCSLLALSPVDPIRAETKLNDIMDRVIDQMKFDYSKTSREQVKRLLTILYTAHLSILLKKEAERLLTEI
ncbi:MAG: DUF1836 domain-containing protein [Clostridiales bacterium]|nr:DUF1836 domain-containing protein [Clostridiales bacterium]